MLYPEARVAVERAGSEPPVSTPGYDLGAHRAAARAAAAAQPREEVAEVADLDAGGVPVRVYRPAEDRAGRGGVVLHLHGGGFVFNDVEVHDGAARRLANRTGSAVVSVDYRLAPEHPFPAAVDDVDAVLAWLDTDGAGAGLTGPLLAHGDSAGANLALVAALRHPGRFAAQALIYPFLDPTRALPSHATETAGFVPEDVAWYWEQYAGGDPSRFEDPDLAPLLHTSYAGLPPTLVATAEHDPLCSEGEELASRMAGDGVHVVATRHLGQVHGFWRHDDAFPAAEPLMLQVASFWDLVRR